MNGFNKQVKRLVNPPRSHSQVLDTFENCGLVNSASIFREMQGI
jgi:hypothetical protein